MGGSLDYFSRILSENNAQCIEAFVVPVIAKVYPPQPIAGYVFGAHWNPP